MVEVEEEGYRRVAHSGLWEPGRRFMHEQLAFIDTIKYDATIWPDFGQITLEDGQFKTDIDPSREHRPLPGDLGALYRLPLAENVMIMLYLLPIAFEQHKVPDWNDLVADPFKIQYLK